MIVLDYVSEFKKGSKRKREETSEKTKKNGRKCKMDAFYDFVYIGNRETVKLINEKYTCIMPYKKQTIVGTIHTTIPRNSKCANSKYSLAYLKSKFLFYRIHNGES